MSLSMEERWALALFEGGAGILRAGEALGISVEVLKDDVVRRVHEAAERLGEAWDGEALLRAVSNRDAASLKHWAAVAGDGWAERPGLGVLAAELLGAGSPQAAPEPQGATTPPPPPTEPAESPETARNRPPPPPRRTIGLETAADVLDELLARTEPQEDVPPPPGIVGETAEWVHRRLVKPYLPSSVAVALNGWGVVLGRKLAYRGQGTGLYTLVVLPMSFGKTSALSKADALLAGAGVSSSHVVGEIQSASAGVERMNQLWRHPVLLMVKDEFERLLADLKDGFGACSFLRVVFSSGDGKFTPDARTKGHGKADLFPIWRPSLSVLAATQPDTLAKATMQRRDLIVNGTLPRFIWILPGRTTPHSVLENLDRPERLDDADADDAEAGRRIATALRKAWDWMRDAPFATMAEAEEAWRKADGQKAEDGTGTLGGIWKHGYLLEADDEVRKIFDLLSAWQERRRAEDEEFGGVFDKFTEKVTRVSMILAGARYAVGFGRDEDSGRIVSSGPFHLDKGEVLWAARWVLAADTAAYNWVKGHIADSYLGAVVNRVREILAKHGGEMPRRDFFKALLNVWSYPEQQAKVLRYMRDDLGMLDVTPGKPEIWRLKHGRGG